MSDKPGDKEHGEKDIDVAMSDTFPASDPPSWGGGITGVRDMKQEEDDEEGEQAD